MFKLEIFRKMEQLTIFRGTNPTQCFRATRSIAVVSLGSCNQSVVSVKVQAERT